MKKIIGICIAMTLAMCLEPIFVYANEVEDPLNDENFQLEKPLTEKEFYEQQKSPEEMQHSEHNYDEIEEGDLTWPRVNRTQVPDDQEVSGSSVFDDEMTVITKGVGSALVEVAVNVPEELHLKNTIIIDISNDTTGDIYELAAYHMNEYKGKMNVPAGEYTVISAMVVNDYASVFSIPTGQTFTVGENDTSTYAVELTLSKGFSSGNKKIDEEEKEDTIVKKAADVSKQIEEKTKGVNNWLYLVVTAVVLLLVIVLIFFYKKNKKSGNRKNSVF